MPKDSVYEEYFERNKVVFNDIFRENHEPAQQQDLTEQKPLGQYVTPLHEQKDADWKQMEADAEALLQHQRHSAFGRLKEDSPEMRAVKESLADLDNSFKEDVMLKPNAFEEQIQTLGRNYHQLISDCAKYIRAKGSPWTKDGKARLAMVKTLYNRAVREWKALEPAARDIFAQLHSVKPSDGEEVQQVKWYRVLQMLRTAELDASQMDVSYLDHNIAGDTLRIQNRGETAYFIPEATGNILYREDLQWEFRSQHAYDQSMEDMLTIIDNIPLEVMAHMLPPQSNVLLEMENTPAARKELQEHPDIKYVLIHDRLTQAQHDAFYDSLRKEKYVDALIRMAKELHEHEVIRARTQDSMNSTDFLHDRSMTAVAASRLSALCDMQDTYAQARLVTLKNGEDTLRGTLLRTPQAANTENFATLLQQSRRSGGPKLTYSPHALAQMSTIGVIDLLLGIPTRALEDYQVEYTITNNTYNIENVVAIQHRASGVVPPEAKPLGGLGEPDLHLPDVMLQNVATMIEQLDEHTLQYLLGDLFSARQMYWVRERLHRMQEMLFYEKNRFKRVEMDEWFLHLKEQAETDFLPEPVQKWLQKKS